MLGRFITRRVLVVLLLVAALITLLAGAAPSFADDSSTIHVAVITPGDRYFFDVPLTGPLTNDREAPDWVKALAGATIVITYDGTGLDVSIQQPSTPCTTLQCKTQA